MVSTTPGAAAPPAGAWGVRTVKGGDGSVPCVSAASIIAKVHRDRLMHTYMKSTRAF